MVSRLYSRHTYASVSRRRVVPGCSINDSMRAKGNKRRIAYGHCRCREIGNSVSTKDVHRPRDVVLSENLALSRQEVIRVVGSAPPPAASRFRPVNRFSQNRRILRISFVHISHRNRQSYVHTYRPCASSVSVPSHPYILLIVVPSEAVHLHRNIDFDDFVRGDLDTLSRLALTRPPA